MGYVVHLLGGSLCTLNWSVRPSVKGERVTYRGSTLCVMQCSIRRVGRLSLADALNQPAMETIWVKSRRYDVAQGNSRYLWPVSNFTTFQCTKEEISLPRVASSYATPECYTFRYALTTTISTLQVRSYYVLSLHPSQVPSRVECFPTSRRTVESSTPVGTYSDGKW